MEGRIKEYTTSTGRYFEVVDGKISMDCVASILFRISISFGVLAVIIQLIFLVLNIDSKIFQMSSLGAATLIGTAIYTFVVGAITTYVSLLLALPIYALIFRDKWNVRYKFKVK